MGKKYIFLLVSSSLLFRWAWLLPAPADAQGCAPLEDLRVELGTGSTQSPWTRYYGVWGYSMTFNPQVCNGFWINSIGIVSDSQNWVELGWWRDQYGNFAYFSLCTIEGKLCSEVNYYSPGINTEHRYKLDHKVGSDYWRFRVDDVVFRRKHTFFILGWALAEQERDTRSTSDPSGSKWRVLETASSSNTWSLWQSIACFTDNDNYSSSYPTFPYYKYNILYTYEFQVLQLTGSGQSDTSCSIPPWFP